MKNGNNLQQLAGFLFFETNTLLMDKLQVTGGLTYERISVQDAWV